MSDHWNSLANLLGTPSIDPLQRKSVAEIKPDPPERKREESPRHDREVASKKPVAVEPETTLSNPPVARTEPPSRIRASWDAVARMFGVGGGPAEAPAPPASTASPSILGLPPSKPDPAQAASDDLFSGFRGRAERTRSVVQDSPSDSDRTSPSSSSHQGSERKSNEPRREARNESRSTSAPGSSKPNSRKKPPSFWDSTPDTPVRDAADSVATDETRPQKDRSDELPPRDRTESSTEGLPERRGRRRNIRRGQREEGASEPRRDSVGDSDPREAPASTSDRNDRDRNRDERGERSERPNRGSRGSRGDRSSDRSSDRSTGRRDRPERVRPEVRDELDRKPDLDVAAEDDWAEIPMVSELDNESLEGDREISREGRDDADGTKRRRRRRGRRSRKTTDDNRDGESLDEIPAGRQAYGQRMSEDEEEEVAADRLTKITSWLDAISPMIESNMENHRKTQHHDHRGRGGQRGSNQRRRGGGNRPSH